MVDDLVRRYKLQAHGSLLVRQRGGILDGFRPTVFAGRNYQRGDGFFGDLWRHFLKPVALPFLAQTAKDVGRSVARSGFDYLGNVLSGETTFRESGKEALKSMGRDAASIALNSIKRQAGMGKRKKSRRRGKVYKHLKRSKTVSKKHLTRKQLFGPR
jgi:hypothetical protein